MDKFNVSMYDEPPSGTELLHNQVQMAEERLKLYKVFQNDNCVSLSNLKAHIKDSFLVHLLSVNESSETKNARRADNIAHWTLRFAYSSNYSDLFIQNELLWFKLRFNNMSSEDRKCFLHHYGFKLTQANDEEKHTFKLKNVWYKFHFTEVPSLVKKRLYRMNNGSIFIPQHKIVFWLLERLERKLKESMSHIRKISQGCFDERLETVVSLLNLVKPPECNRTSFPFELNDLERKIKNFPLCMKLQHEHLKQNHHLKHGSRLQYGLFLKGLGLSLEDVLQMWKTEFTKDMSEEVFLKKYSYFLKHIYGTVGSKIDYKPFSCDKIQTRPVQPAQIHGCPFVHWDNGVLVDKLKKERISDVEIIEIVGLRNEKRYCEACSGYFKALHKTGLKQVIRHPNEYYEMSCGVGMVDIEDIFT